MKTELTTSNLRQKIHSQIRKADLHQFFSRNRQQLITTQMETRQKKQFQAIYPTIDHTNFCNFLSKVSSWAWNPRFCNKTLLLVGYLYDYLMSNTDENGLSILQALSSMDQIQIPQTKMLAELLIAQLNMRARTALTIISNLMANSKYIQCLGDHFLNSGLIEYCRKCLVVWQQQLPRAQYGQLSLLFVDICCSILTGHSSLDTNIFDNILQDLSINYKGVKNQELIFWCIYQMAVSFKPNEQIAKCIDKHFGDLCLQRYFDYQLEVTSYYQYYCRSSQILSDAAVRLIITCIDNSNKQIWTQVISILALSLKSWPTDKIQQIAQRMEEISFCQKLISKYEISNQQSKVKCLEILNTIFVYVLADYSGRSQNKRLPVQFVLIIKDSIEYPCQKLQTQGLLFLAIILRLTHQQQCWLNECVKDQLQEFNIIEKIQSMQSSQDDQRCKLLSYILRMYECL